LQLLKEQLITPPPPPPPPPPPTTTTSPLNRLFIKFSEPTKDHSLEEELIYIPTSYLYGTYIYNPYKQHMSVVDRS
jgi:hypothetical protein